MGTDEPDDLGSAPTLGSTPRTAPRAGPADDATLRPSPTPPNDRLGSTSGPPRPAGAGTRDSIGRFAVERRLGEGGMGAVYLATDPALGRRVAIKVLHQDAAGDDESRRRLVREAQATAQLAHEHVVVVHEVGTHDDQVYLAMEYVAGATLKAWQAGRGWREVLAMYRRAGQGLRAAHEAGLVHRDFKPDNVLVGDDGRVRVTDFGLVATVDDGAPPDLAALRSDLDLEVSMTRTGSIMGTPRYMAPEQHLGEDVDARADQFAFCVALYEAWFHRAPFAGERYEALVAHVVGGEVRSPPEDSDVPAALRDAVMRGLARRRDDRFPSMAALLAALEPEPAVTSEAIVASPPRRPRIAWIGAALAAAIALVIVVLATRSRGGAGRGAVTDLAACPAPLIDPEQVLPDATLGTLARSRQAPAAKVLQATLADWRDARRRVCTGPAAERGPRAACLDAVLSAIDATAKGLASIPGTPDDRRAARVLVRLDGPELCLGPAVPSLRVYSPARARMLEARMRADAGALEARVSVFDPRLEGLDELRAQAANDPCATAALELAAAPPYAETPPAVPTLVEQCGDDLLRRDVAARDASFVLLGTSSATAQDRYLRLVAAADRLPSVRSKVAVLTVRGRIAVAKDDLASEIADAVERARILATAGDPPSYVGAALQVAGLRVAVRTAAELATAMTELTALRAAVERDLPGDALYLASVDQQIAFWMQVNAREQEAHEILERIASTPLVPNVSPRRVTGLVVDDRGAPVAGATVFADRRFEASSFTAAEAVFWSRRKAVTGADGRFVIPDAVPSGMIVAELGSRRSVAREIADEVELALADTSVVAGHVELNGTSFERLEVFARDPAATVDYPQRTYVRADGAFELRGLRRGKVVLMLTEFQGHDGGINHQVRELVVGPRVPAIRLVANPPRVTRVLVRSAAATPMDGARLWIVRGRLASGRLARLTKRLDGGAAYVARIIEPAELAALGPVARAGDFFDEIRSVPPGAASVCAIPLPQGVGEDVIAAHAAAVEVRCAPVPADDTPVVLEVPPLPRLD